MQLFGTVTKAKTKGDPPSNDPYYLTLANELRAQLLSGRYRPGQRFHSIRGLIKESRRSLPTVRAALGLLINEQLLEPRHGSGYYVTGKIETASNAHRGFRNFLAVIPSSTDANEPWFTGKISVGMIRAANVDHAVVSFYKRRTPGDSSPQLVKMDLERIMAVNPDGVAWLHSIPPDAPILRKLQESRVPVVTTMRRLGGIDLPLIHEDNVLYASIVLSNFEAWGHRRIGMIIRALDDQYFRAKVEAFREVASTLRVRVAEEDFFFLPADDPTGENQDGALRKFLDSRPDLTGLMVLAATGIRPVVKLFEGRYAERMKKLSLIYNVLDGVDVPVLPTGETLATIYPPLEKLGEQLVHYLSAAVDGKPVDNLPRLVPIFQSGDSLRRA
jgi:DNA-binding LacI/PurR family transcriptional regulator